MDLEILIAQRSGRLPPGFVPHAVISDQWVTLEIEVRGDESIRHQVNGATVFEYAGTQLDDTDPDAQRLLNAGAPIALREGLIAIQAESHPTQFRRIEVLPL